MDPITALIITFVMLTGITALRITQIINFDAFLICAILILILNRLMI